jgi:hypothetical protein
LTATSHAAAAWAGMALSQLDWLGAPVRLVSVAMRKSPLVAGSRSPFLAS